MVHGQRMPIKPGTLAVPMQKRGAVRSILTTNLLILLSESDMSRIYHFYLMNGMNLPAHMRSRVWGSNCIRTDVKTCMAER